MSKRSSWSAGIALGLALALIGPAGISVGFYSHPVGDSSHPDYSAQIFGQVLDDQTGLPARSVCVELRLIATDVGDPYPDDVRFRSHPRTQTRVTDEQGRYSAKVIPGLHTVRFHTNCPTLAFDSYAAMYHDGVAFSGISDGIDVADGEAVEIDARMLAGGRITGTLTDSANNNVSVGCIQFLHPNFDPLAEGTATPTQDPSDWTATRTRSDSSGRYLSPRLLEGAYNVDFVCGESKGSPAPFGYAREIVHNIGVASGAQTGLDRTLVRLGSIAGKILNRNGDTLRGLLLRFATGPKRFHGKDQTDWRGIFESPGLVPGTYAIWHDRSYWTSGYDSPGFIGGPTFGSATKLTVSEGEQVWVELAPEILQPEILLEELEVHPVGANVYAMPVVYSGGDMAGLEVRYVASNIGQAKAFVQSKLFVRLQGSTSWRYLKQDFFRLDPLETIRERFVWTPDSFGDLEFKVELSPDYYSLRFEPVSESAAFSYPVSGAGGYRIHLPCCL